MRPQMPDILLIDTSSEKGIVALARNGSVAYLEENTDARNHAATINMMIDSALQSGGITISQLDAVAVIGGPGSYTGLRIGLATAKGICYAADKPLIMTNKLDLLAMQGGNDGRYELVAAALPAREKEYFFTLLSSDGEHLRAPEHVYEDDLVRTLTGAKGKLRISGLLPKTITDITTVNHIDYVENEVIDPDFLAFEVNNQFICHTFVNVATAEPFYLKQVYTHKP